MTFEQATAVLLAYDVLPKVLQSPQQRAALAAANDVVKDVAYRALNDFIHHESSAKYLHKEGAVTINDGTT